MAQEIFNPNPIVFSGPKTSSRSKDLSSGKALWVGEVGAEDKDLDEVEPIDQDEIFGTQLIFQKSVQAVLITSFPDLIRHIYDPEHPNTLEDLRVVSAEQIDVTNNCVKVEFTPTVPHCGMSTLIGESRVSSLFDSHTDPKCCLGLSIRVRLLRSLPNRFKVDICVKPGSHQSELAGALHCPLSDLT